MEDFAEHGPRKLCLTGLKLDFPMSVAIISGVTTRSPLTTLDGHVCTRERM